MIKNPLKIIWKRIKEIREMSKRCEIENAVLRDIRIENDTKDAENSVYVFVGGVPVVRLDKITDLQDNTLDIGDSSEYVDNIKENYRRYLEGNSIRQEK